MSETTNGKGCNAFEDSINNVLSGATLQNALSFAAYLRENDIIAGGKHGVVRYRDKDVCYIHMDGAEQLPGPWTIWTEGDYSAEHKDVPLDEHMKEIAWAHVNFCTNCGGGCNPGTDKTILGRDFAGVCSAAMAFNDPDAETLECVKKLLEMRIKG